MSKLRKGAKKNNLNILNNHNDDNRIIFNDKFRPVNSYESTILTISSFLFMIPGYYAYQTELYLYSIVSVITSLVSANHWRHPMEGWRRNADLITAKVSFVIYTISGCVFLRKNLYLLYIAGPVYVMIIVFYYLSNYFRKIDSELWVYFHLLFHISAVLEKYLILYGGLLIDAR